MLKRVVSMTMKNPEENLPRLADWVATIAPLESHRQMASSLKRFLEDRSGNWYQLAHRLMTETNPVVRERTANESVDEFADKMASYASSWHQVADEIWDREHKTKAPDGVD